MEKEKSYFQILNDYDFYKDTVLDEVLSTINEAIKHLDKTNVYQTVLRASIESERVDILKEIYEYCHENARLNKQMQEHFYYSITHSRFKVVDFLIDKKIPLKTIDMSIKYVLPLFPLSLLKKFHENTHNLTDPDLHLLEHSFNQYPANFENIDYLLSIGLKIEDNYKEIAKCLFMNYNIENIDKIDYLYNKGIDLSQKNNIILMFAIQSEMPMLLDHLLSKGIDKNLHDEYVEHAFIFSLRNNNSDYIKEMVEKGITFNVNSQNFLKALGELDSIEVFKYCITLGLDVNNFKLFVSSQLPCQKITNYLITESFKSLNNSVEVKKENNKIKKVKI